jgi:leucyl-tRNA synthetase
LPLNRRGAKAGHVNASKRLARFSKPRGAPEHYVRACARASSNPREVKEELPKLVCVVALLATPAHAQSLSEQTLQKACKDRWGVDYSMREYCINQQRKAVESLARTNTRYETRALCAERWPDEFAMRVYCEQQQNKAYERLR